MEEGDETVEDIAEEYLYELVRRCMIQVGRRGHTGRVKTCRLHDLMRDLCISKAKEEGFAHTIKLGDENEGTNLKKVSFRRLCISSGNHERGESVLSSLRRISPHLRSIWFKDNLGDYQWEAALIVRNLKLVRVFELPSILWTLMDEGRREQVGNLIHMRFLNLEVSMLPKSIGNLICLQTLNLGRCDSDLKIPDSVWRMEQLRHLYLPKDGGVCENRKQHVSHFQNLQTLVNFPPKNFDLQQNLAKFINVRKLVIINMCEEISKILQSPGIVFNRLQSLSFTDSSKSVDLRAVTRSCPCLYRLVVIATMKFTTTSSCSVVWPSNLTKLVLRLSGLDESHMRSLGKLQSLKVLFLQKNAFAGREMVFHENDFPQLRHLIIAYLEHLETWAVQEGALPNLFSLEIVNCWELKSVADGAQYLKQLKELKVRNMPYMFRKRLELGGEDWDRVGNVPSISFSYCCPELEIEDHTSSDILDENSSLELLKKTILFLGDLDHPITENSEMETSAREMVKVCQGVPLAITILGRILARKHEMKEWESIESFLRERERKGNGGVTSVLELSYEDLPCNLKSCFLSFAQQVKNEETKTTEMIQRWIGEGFVTSSMEEVGQEYLNELVTRRLIQAGKRSHAGRVKTCRMDELVWHFCVSKAKEEGFAHSLEFGLRLRYAVKNLEKENIHRLCVSSGWVYDRDWDWDSDWHRKSIVSSLVKVSPQLISIRFLDYFDEKYYEAAVLIVKNLKLVKVLTLPSIIWSLLDESGRELIGNLANLTFLKLQGSELPKSFENLRFLQTLDLKRCVEDLIIPDSVWRMEQLRHLYLPEGGGVCESSRPQVGDFLNLQTLVNFPPRNFDLQRNLVKFSNVKKLVIIEKGEEMGRILRSQEIEFNRLQALSILYSYGKVDLEALTRGCPCLDRLFVEGSIKLPSAPSCTAIWPSNLTKLVLRYTSIDQIQLGSVAKLQSLKVLSLQWNAFAGKEMVFHKNDLPQLHHLVIDSMVDLETWVVHEGALSNLLCLEIGYCLELKSVPDGSQYLKQLKELKVKGMPYSFRKRLEEGGEDWDRVCHVHSISYINCDRSSNNIRDAGEERDAEQSSGDRCLKQRSSKRLIDDGNAELDE